MRLNWDNTSVGLLGDEAWNWIDSPIQQQTGVTEWTKVNVADEVLACAYFHGATADYAAYTYHPPTVRGLKRLLESEVASEIPRPFPATRDDTTTRACCHNSTVKYVWSKWLPKSKHAPRVSR